MMMETGSRIKHYEVISAIGAGGMGEVYLAEDTRLGRKVALKLLPAEFTKDGERLRRFEQEAKAVSALNHPHIITIHEIGEAEAGHFIVMELVQGQTLRSLHKPCPLDLLVNLGRQIAKALSATHAAGITHRDIKPDNIMLRQDGYVKVLDFGLARPTTATGLESATLTQQTMPGMLLGTVAYMSPEQARGEAVSHASDIFALGTVFYELATGEHPFKAVTLLGQLHAINSQAPLPPARLTPDLPTALEGLILQMLDKEGRLRPTAAEVDQALAELSGRGGSGQLERPAAKPAIERHTVGREKERAELRVG
ncbi:MAG: serine/threonine-protein kinase, partial [Terriglobales bacterium]